MLKFSGFHLRKPIILSIGVLGLMFIGMDASAQSENEKVEEIYPKGNDRVILEDHTLIQDNSSLRLTPAKPNVIQKPVTTVIKRDQNSGENLSDRDLKKERISSFHTFF
ncbi:hypothetical protein [Algoriphagus boritolerans]|uniref:hypothetical protein n=1 Tax=Algoriphagus boritolerans TaxID=308111 RepID=UPI000A9531A7